jgi:uncharacterized membrane protein YheB (UPF0754 family)
MNILKKQLFEQKVRRVVREILSEEISINDVVKSYINNLSKKFNLQKMSSDRLYLNNHNDISKIKKYLIANGWTQSKFKKDDLYKQINNVDYRITVSSIYGVLKMA